MVDPKTIAYYDIRAPLMADRYESADVTFLHQRLLKNLPFRGRILEVGCGSGRDMAFLHANGFDVTAFEPSEGLRSQALARHPELTERVHDGFIPFAHGQGGLDPPYDGLVAIAVIMHLANRELEAWIQQLPEILRPEGILFLSASDGREGVSNGRDENGRLFIERQPEHVEHMMRQGGLVLERTYHSRDTLMRSIHWFTQVYRREPRYAGL